MTLVEVPMRKPIEQRMSELEAIVGEILQYMDDQDDLSLEALRAESAADLRSLAVELREQRVRRDS